MGFVLERCAGVRNASRTPASARRISATDEEAAGAASQAVPPLFPEFGTKRKIPGNSSTARRGIPEKGGGFASAENASRPHTRSIRCAFDAGTAAA